MKCEVVEQAIGKGVVAVAGEHMADAVGDLDLQLRGERTKLPDAFVRDNLAQFSFHEDEGRLRAARCDDERFPFRRGMQKFRRRRAGIPVPEQASIRFAHRFGET